MRKLFIALTFVAIALPATVHANSGDRDTVFFWEDGLRYGWSEVPHYRHGLGPPKILKKNVSLGEHCGRLVGRLMLTDDSSRRHSTFLEDACARNGGKL